MITKYILAQREDPKKGILLQPHGLQQNVPLCADNLAVSTRRTHSMETPSKDSEGRVHQKMTVGTTSRQQSRSRSESPTVALGHGKNLGTGCSKIKRNTYHLPVNLRLDLQKLQ